MTMAGAAMREKRAVITGTSCGTTRRTSNVARTATPPSHTDADPRCTRSVTVPTRIHRPVRACSAKVNVARRNTASTVSTAFTNRGRRVLGLRSAGNASRRSPARINQDWPKRVSMTSRSAVVSHIAEMFWVVVYAACMPMPNSAVTKPTTQLTHRSPRTPWSSPASPDTVRRKTMPPIRTSTDPNASARVSPNAIPTPWFVSFFSSPATLPPVAAPTVNVKAPLIGCESAETTCQSTTYVPSARLGSDATTTELLAPCFASPTPGTALPLLASTRTPSFATWTPSLNVSVTAAGGFPAGYDWLAPGSLLSSEACAKAGSAVTNTTAATSPAARRNRLMP